MAYTGERSSVFQAIKLAPEAVPGTAPASGYKKLTAMGLTPTINPTVNSFRPAGQKYTTVTALNREDTTWSLDGLPTYTEIVYPLSSVLTEALITAAGGTTSAAAGSRVMGADGTHWFFKPSAVDADAPVSFTVYKGSVVAAERSSFVRLNDFTLTMNRNDTTLGGGAMGRALEKGQHMPGNEVQQLAVNATSGTYTLTYAGQTTTAIAFDATDQVLLAALEALSNIAVGALRVTQTVNASPAFTYTVEFGGSLGETDVAAMTSTATGLLGGTATATITEITAGSAISDISLVPILPTDICIYAFATAPSSISDTSGEIAANKLTDVMEVGFNMGSRFGAYYTLDCAQDSFNTMVETPPTLQLTTRMQANSEGLAYLDTLRNGGTVFFRVKAVGQTIATAEEYEFTMDFAGKVTAASDLSDSDGVYAVTWTWDGVPVLAGGGPLEVAVVNDVTSL